mmetsp:Transcript_4137/g.13603  ORF Transcript_4137/g.13603 Transcript_4137/m.13603 type:complete len:274 (-) Transcript_4137:5-826(-)
MGILAPRYWKPFLPGLTAASAPRRTSSKASRSWAASGSKAPAWSHRSLLALEGATTSTKPSLLVLDDASQQSALTTRFRASRHITATACPTSRGNKCFAPARRARRYTVYPSKISRFSSTHGLHASASTVADSPPVASAHRYRTVSARAFTDPTRSRQRWYIRAPRPSSSESRSKDPDEEEEEKSPDAANANVDSTPIAATTPNDKATTAGSTRSTRYELFSNGASRQIDASKGATVRRSAGEDLDDDDDDESRKGEKDRLSTTRRRGGRSCW